MPVDNHPKMGIPAVEVIPQYFTPEVNLAEEDIRSREDSMVWARL